MAAQWADDFTQYGTTEAFMLNGLYAEVEGQLITDPDPTPGTDDIVYRLDTAINQVTTRKVLSSSQTTVGIALRQYLTSLPTGSGSERPNYIQFRDVNNTVNVTIVINSTGALSVYRGMSNGTLLGTTAGPAYVANAWQHTEVKVFFSSTVGTVEIRVDGITVLTLTGLNNVAGLAECSQFVLSPQGAGSFSGIPYATICVRDLFVWDGTGSQNNDFAGSVSVIRLAPTADASFPWAASTGTTGWDILDNNPPVDATYVYAVDPPPAEAVFEFANLPADVTSVRALMTLVRAAKSDGGDGNLQVGLRSGVANDLGADRPITTAFTYWYDFSETDPATSLPWTPVAVDAAQLTLDRTV